jgi:type I restriction enzyme S subunit
VRGKLVEQDHNDEPAGELLKRIRAEKSKKGTALSRDLPHELPFALPPGWSVAHFGDVYSLEYGDNLPAEKRSNTGEYPVYGSNGIVGSHFECFVRSPCIIVGRKGSAGALNLSLTEGCCVTDVAYYCIPPSGLDLAFSFKMFHTLGLDSLGKGVKPGLSRNEVYVLPIAIPPFAEQHRIVAKVDELMVLCDQLEAALKEREILHRRLLEAVLQEALAPAIQASA